MSTTNQLPLAWPPAKLHQLLKIALDEYDLQLNNPNIHIDMRVWVERDDDDNTKCYACLAGLMLLKHAQGETLQDKITYAQSQLCNKVPVALDWLRSGHITRAIHSWGYPYEQYKDMINVAVARHSTDPARWRQDMNAVLFILQLHDL